MHQRSFDEALKQILSKDPRYPSKAYVFAREVMDFTAESLKKPTRGPARHITGAELCDGMRRYALQEFGPVARTVLAALGITRTEDLGELIFNLVNHGFLGKTDEDSPSDFAGGFDFVEAFDHPFLPSSLKKNTARRHHEQPFFLDVAHE